MEELGVVQEGQAALAEAGEDCWQPRLEVVKAEKTCTRRRLLQPSLSQEQMQWKRREVRALQEQPPGRSLVEGQHHLRGEGEGAEVVRAAEKVGERAWEALEPRLLAVQAGQVLLAASRILKRAE